MIRGLITGIVIGISMYLIGCILLAYQANARTILLNETNTINFIGEVNDRSTKTVKKEISRLDIARGNKKYPLYLVIDSPGGSIHAGNRFLDYVKTVKNLHTVTIFAASMAAGFVQQLPGKRYVVDSGIFMFHRASGGFQGIQ